jgi:nucleoid-associated protein YgaU
LEKIVVLAVLLLVAVVLGVALNTDDPTILAKNGPLGRGQEEPSESAAARDSRFEAPPLTGASQVAPRGSAQPHDTELPVSRSGAAPGGLLEAGIDPEALRPAGQPVSIEPPSANRAARSEHAPAPEPVQPSANGLSTTVGLTQTPLPDLMQYTWQAGDDFAGLAERFYGARDRVSRLHAANEGLRDADMRVGSKVWIPTGVPAKRDPAPKKWKAGELYVVQSGDILGKISQTVYGTSRDWRKIFNANRDILSDPDSLRQGMKLRIPE